MQDDAITRIFQSILDRLDSLKPDDRSFLLQLVGTMTGKGSSSSHPLDPFPVTVPPHGDEAGGPMPGGVEGSREVEMAEWGVQAGPPDPSEWPPDGCTTMDILEGARQGGM